MTTVVEKVVKKTSGEPPRFVRPIQPCVVRDGDSCQFSAAVAGVPIPEISWLKDKVLVLVLVLIMIKSKVKVNGV